MRTDSVARDQVRTGDLLRRRKKLAAVWNIAKTIAALSVNRVQLIISHTSQEEEPGNSEPLRAGPSLSQKRDAEQRFSRVAVQGPAHAARSDQTVCHTNAVNSREPPPTQQSSVSWLAPPVRVTKP